MSAQETARSALVGVLEGIQYRALPFAPDSLSPPQSFVGTITSTYDTTMGGDPTLLCQVWFVVSRVDAKTGLGKVEEFEAAFIGAVDDDPSLDDEVDSARVVSSEMPLTVEYGQNQFYAARFDVEVFV